MKKYILTSITLLGFAFCNSQVIINKDTNQQLSSTSVLLEFGSQPKGLLLPWIMGISNTAGAVPGTIVFDTSDKKVKFLKGGSSSIWTDLSIDNTGIVDTSLQNSLNDNVTAKTIIGANASSAPGILVLESSNKAMVLPKVASPHLNIINPSPGMIVYDTTKKQLAVFNGNVWAFWTYTD
ncbi:hypothetical protein [Chryseobacterium defluvii]|uniref:Uncharacterized protein n=1 Tax=Chryseobacterium defluvii TaxID=160396 RepID=A0A495SPY2_9FLAO|nr:hypothetical protein [Chryseobacterium defluvii]RKT01745.1 hypothetical protein BCF58_0969 [Chryseobacterium defluvii]